MSTVLVDAGNARLKWASLEENPAHDMRITDVHAVGLDSVEQAIDAFCNALPALVDTIVVGNVAGRQFGEKLAHRLRQPPRKSVWFARSRSVSCGVRSAYAQPHTLGVDRWAAIVAGFRQARARAPARPVCVVDAGTALTIDAISPSGNHLGGVILPGLRLQRKALLDAAADITVPLDDPAVRPQSLDVFANSTSAALAFSGRLACAATIDRCVRTASAQSSAAYVLLTGGDAPALAPWLETRAEICPNLVFEGLAMLFAEGKSE